MLCIVNLIVKNISSIHQKVHFKYAMAYHTIVNPILQAYHSRPYKLKNCLLPVTKISVSYCTNSTSFILFFLLSFPFLPRRYNSITRLTLLILSIALVIFMFHLHFIKVEFEIFARLLLDQPGQTRHKLSLERQLK